MPDVEPFEAFDTDGFRRFDALPEEEQARLLDRLGPRLPRRYNVSDLSLRVFVQGGWPVAIDYQLISNANARLSIEVEGVEPLILQLPPMSRRDPLRFIIPDSFGTEQRVAKLRITALTRAAIPAPFNLLGIGMGKRGVRTTARLNATDSGPRLAALSFAPVSPPVAAQDGTSILISVNQPTAIKTRLQPKQVVKFDCAARDDFDNGTWEMWLTNGLDWRHVWSNRIGSLTRNRKSSGTWDGRGGGGAVSAGDHALQLTAWRGRESDGNWVVARAETRLFVE